MAAGQDGRSVTASGRCVRMVAFGAAVLALLWGSMALAPARNAGAWADMTPTPGTPPRSGDKDGVTPPSGRAPIGGEISGIADPAGQVTATITLAGPSGAEVFASLRTPGETGVLSRAALAAAWQAVLNTLSQRDLIAALTAPDIGATVIGQSQLAANSITVLVDAAKIPAIRSLPGVRSVTVNVPEVIDPIYPPQDQLDLGQQPPGDQLD